MDETSGARGGDAGGDVVTSVPRAVAAQLTALATDELRMLVRSRRGRLTALTYLLVSLIPLALQLWLRTRFVIPWPVEATDIASLLELPSLCPLLLTLLLGHDLLTRGDREGWQDALAAQPVGELSWALGRLAGRAAFLLATIVVPWLVGWSAGSIWAGRALDPVPFLAGLLGGPCLVLVATLPMAVIAGCIGNSLVGAAIVLGLGLAISEYAVQRSGATFGAADVGVVAPLLEGGKRSLEATSEAVSIAANINPLMGQWLLESMAPRLDPGRGWPPLRTMAQWLRAWLAVLSLLVFLVVAPSLVRLRRRPGRLNLRVPRLPTMSAWLAELVDQIRPAAPDGRTARRVALGALVVAVGWIAHGALVAARLVARERAMAAPFVTGAAASPWPSQLVPSERRLRVRMLGNGSLEVWQRLQGRVEGRLDRPLPFALAPGMRVIAVGTEDGRSLAWQRDETCLWVAAGDTRELTLMVTVVGWPHRIERRSLPFIRQWERSEQWSLLEPIAAPPWFDSVRRWAINLEGVMWAPEPLAGANGPVRSCLGMTHLEAELPARLVPAPFPGEWHEQRRGDLTIVSWRGVSYRLPPLAAGRLRRASRAGVELAVTGAGTDTEALLDAWQRATDAVARPRRQGSFALRSLGVETIEERWRFFEREPTLDRPLGQVELPPRDEARNRSIAQTTVDLERLARKAAAHERYAMLAPRLATPGPSPARWLVWQLCRQLAGLLPYRIAMTQGPKPAVWVRAVRLPEPPSPGQDEAYDHKLSVVAKAALQALGVEQVELGFDTLAQGTGELDLEQLWAALADERRAELVWFERDLLLGRGLAAPRLDSVASERVGAGFLLRAELTNEGDAATVVPVKVISAVAPRTERVALAARGRARLELELAVAPEQLLIDPDRETLRQKTVGGERWTRWGGLQ